jgi:hypothetical protein
MKKIWSLLQHRIVWTSCAALLVIVAVPAIVGLVLKALGLVHGASLHTWLLDSTTANVPPHGVTASGGAAVGATTGGKGSGKGGKGSGIKNPVNRSGDGLTHPGDYTPTIGGPDDPSFKEAQKQLAHDMHANDPVPTPAPTSKVNALYNALQYNLSQGQLGK